MARSYWVGWTAAKLRLREMSHLENGDLDLLPNRLAVERRPRPARLLLGDSVALRAPYAPSKSQVFPISAMQ